MIKDFRKNINMILLTKESHLYFDNKKFFLTPKYNEKNTLKSMYEFFLTVIAPIEGDNFSGDLSNLMTYYYNFTPLKLVIYFDNKKKNFEKKLLTLKETQNVYKLSKYWGLSNTIKKCIFPDRITGKNNFSFEVLENLPNEYIDTLKKESRKGNFLSIERNKTKIIKINKNFHLLVRECLLCRKIININYFELKYYDIPLELLEYILDSKNNGNILPMICSFINKILKEEENKKYNEIIYIEKKEEDNSKNIGRSNTKSYNNLKYLQDLDKKEGKDQNKKKFSFLRLKTKNINFYSHDPLIGIKSFSNNIKKRESLKRLTIIRRTFRQEAKKINTKGKSKSFVFTTHLVLKTLPNDYNIQDYELQVDKYHLNIKSKRDLYKLRIRREYINTAIDIYKLKKGLLSGVKVKKRKGKIK